MQARSGSKVLDRAAMIEAASRSLRQQMRARDRPRSKGSLHDRDSGAIVDLPEQESSKRRIHSAENKYRMVSHRDGPEVNQSASSGALESYPAEEEPGDATTNSPPGGWAGPAPDEIPPLGDLKRPMSRKKVPSASAAAGLGACAFGHNKMTDAFEQRKTRQPIPIESWGPRPPSRTSNRRLPNATLLDMSLLTGPGADEDWCEPKLIPGTGATRTRSEPQVSSGRPSSRAGSESGVSGTKWAAARSSPGSLSTQGLNDSRRGRKADPDLGVMGFGSRSPNGQSLSKNLSGVFDHHNSEYRERMAERENAVRQAAGSWAAHVDTAAVLEVNGSALGEHNNLWLQGAPSLAARKARMPEAVSVEDVEAEQDLGSRAGAYRMDPPRQVAQVVLTRSSTQKKDRSEVRRARDDRQPRGRQRTSHQPGHQPFSTNLDVDFLSLFAL
jgi:hypothetical protein